MTENTQVSNDVSQKQEAQSPTVAPITSTETPAPKLYTDADVDRIVSAKIKREREANASNSLPSQQSQPVTQPQQNMGGMPQLTPEQMDARIDQRLQQKQQEQWLQGVQKQLNDKIEEAKTRYSDFDEVTRQVDFRTMPEIPVLANEMDNSMDVMYDLAKNPAKLGTILTLAQRDANAARAYMKSLSESIKQNQTALNQANQSKVNEPLSQVKPSNVGMDNGSHTVRDLRRQPWLKA